MEPVPIDLIPAAKQIKTAAQHLSAEVEQMIECEIAERTSKGLLKAVQDSKWCFSFFPVKGKRRGRVKKRTAVDFRRLIPMFRVVEHRISICEEIIDQIPSGSCYFTSLDETKAFTKQASLHPPGCLTIRVPHSGSWHCEGLPLGAANAAALFQEEMENLLGYNLLSAGVSPT